jgi:hypothetical protein
MNSWLWDAHGRQSDAVVTGCCRANRQLIIE